MKVDTFQKIFVAVDDSKISIKAFQYAYLLAHNSRTPLQIVQVVEEFGNVGCSISKELVMTGQEILQKYKPNSSLRSL
ncbi:MAG TPA: universal stress protein [Nitrososphaeraceae archaeon]